MYKCLLTNVGNSDKVFLHTLTDTELVVPLLGQYTFVTSTSSFRGAWSLAQSNEW